MKVLVIILVLLGLGGGAFFYLSTMKESLPIDTPAPLVEKTTTETGKAESPFGKFSITSDVTTTETCDSEGCFEDKFETCTPATLNAESPLGSVYYEILGPVENGCSLKMMYTQNPNPEWVNKEMACVADNSLVFQQAVEKMFNDVIAGDLECTGPLFEVLSTL